MRCWMADGFMNMAAHLVMFVTVIILMIKSLLTGETSVSQDRGHDWPSCGSIDKPCQTIPYAIKHIITSGDVIVVDGGNLSQLTYMLSESVNVTKHFSIVGAPDSNHLPLLTTRNLHFPILKFFERNSLYNCTFVSVHFEDTTISERFAETSGVVKIIECTIRNTVLDINQDKVRLQGVYVEIKSSDIYNTSLCRQKSHGRFIDNELYISIHNSSLVNFVFLNDWLANRQATLLTLVFQDNKFVNSIINVGFSPPGSGLLTFIGSSLYNSVVKVSGKCNILRCVFSNTSIASYASSLNIDRSVLKEIKDGPLIFIYTGFMVFQDSVFINNTNNKKSCVIEVTASLSITNCLFKNNIAVRGGTLCLRISPSVSISNSMFINNTAKYGGAISVQRVVTSYISNTTFIDNNALEYGGAIYSEGADSKMRRITLRNVSIKQSILRYATVIGRIIYSESQLIFFNVSMEVTFSTEFSPIVYYKKREGAYLIIKSYRMVCPIGHRAMSRSEQRSERKEGKASFTSFCVPCGRGMYNLSSGEEYKLQNKSELERTSITCSPCPSGGICDSNIVSVGNFWGYKNNANQIVFAPCPLSYCCNSHETKCSSYDTCAQNREGRLCGTCRKGFTLNLLSSSCVSISNATHLSQTFYVGAQIVSAIVYILCLMYLKEITLTLKRLVKGHCPEKTSIAATPLLPSTSNDVSSTVDVDEVNNLGGDDIVLVVTREHTTESETKEVKTKKMISGLMKIAFFFYQIEPLFRVDTSAKGKYKYDSWILQILISSVFNVKLNTESTGMVFAPFERLNAVYKNVLKISFVFTMFIVLLILYWSHKIVLLWKEKHSENQEDSHLEPLLANNDESGITIGMYAYQPLPVRIKCCAVKISLLAYVTLSVFAFKSVNCVPLGDTLNLYLQGDIQCYTVWQWVVIGWIVFWVVPYCFTLYISSKLLHASHVSPNEFLSMLLCPPLSIIYYARSKNHDANPISKADAMIAKHFLSNLYDSYKQSSNQEPVIWEGVMIFRKLSLVCAATFVIHPVGKLYTVLALLMIYSMIHSYVRPYAEELLNTIETCCLALLCFLASLNLFWAYVYMWNDINIPYLDMIGEVFLFFELVVLVSPFIIVTCYVLYKVTVKVHSVCKLHFDEKQD